MLHKAFNILIAPTDFKSFSCSVSVFNLTLWDIIAAISSAASSVILFLLKSNWAKVVMLHKAFDILIAPADFKLFPSSASASNLMLWDIPAAISSAASSLMLFLVKFK